MGIPLYGCVMSDWMIVIALNVDCWQCTLAHEFIGFLAWTGQVDLSPIEAEFLRDPRYTATRDEAIARIKYDLAENH